jgi:hypothetical protein
LGGKVAGRKAAGEKAGQLIVSVLDARGIPTPAIVQLRSEESGDVRAPDEIVSLAGQSDGMSTTGLVTKILPRKLSGRYWCVSDRGVRATLEPGRWTLTILRGMEYVPLRLTVTVPPGGSVDQQVTLERWVDAPALGWYSGDDHVHARLMDDEDARRLVTYGAAEDVHVLNILAMGSMARTWFAQRGFGRSFRVDGGAYILVPGQEDPRVGRAEGDPIHMGHALALNLGSSMVRFPSHYFLYGAMFDAAREQGATTGYAHVNLNLDRVDHDMSINVPKGKVDFAEILQFDSMDTRLYYEFLDLGFRLTASAGSDFPWGDSIGEARVFAHVGKDRPFDADRWFDAFEGGNTFVSNALMLDFQVDEALPGGEIQTSEERMLRVRARAYGHPDMDTPQRLEIVRFGEVVREVRSEAASTEELGLDFEISSAQGFWIAARAYGWDGTMAHSSPIWVVREGLRPWDRDRVAQLLDLRLASLDELRRGYQRLRERTPGHPFVMQWDELRQQIDAAEAEYQELRILVKSELAESSQRMR